MGGGAAAWSWRELLRAFGTGLGVSLLLAGAAGIAVSRRISAPLTRLAGQVGFSMEGAGAGYAEAGALERALEEMQRRLEEAAERERYRELFDTAADPMMLVDAAGRILELNEEAKAVAGPLVPGTDLRAYVPPASVNALLARARAGDRSPLTVRVDTEPVRHFEVRARAVTLSGRQMVLLQGRDVTDRVRAERRVRAQEAFLRWVLDHLDEAVLILDPSRRVRYYNRPFVAMWGLDPEFLDGRPSMEETMHEVARLGLYDERAVDALVRRRVEDLGRPGPVRPIHTPRRDGRSVEAFAARLPGGGFLLTYRDVTERVRQDRERALLAAVVEQSREGMAMASPLGALVYANSAYETLCGMDRASLMGRRYWDVPEGDGLPHEEVEAALAAGEPWSGRVVLVRRGEEVVHEVGVTEIEVPPGERYRVIVRRDVTESLHLHAQLAQAQKMEAIGVLAGGVAHDFNNILMALLGNIEVLKARLPSQGSHAAPLARMERAVGRASDLVRRILTFSGRQPRSEGPVDLRVVVDEAVGFARSGASEGVRIVWDRRAAPDAVTWGEASELCQAVLNLLVNAVQAVGPRGRVEVTVEQEGGEARIRVRDDGPGIPDEVRDRVFDPFFTTKPPGEGTGLGLALVKAIVERHGGAVEIGRAEPQGTEVSMRIPLRHREGESARGSGDAPAFRFSVLVVDDDPDVAEALAESLRGRGHRADVAGSGEEALARWASGNYEAVVCDAGMPGMDGRTVIERVKRGCPGAATVLLTGRLEDLPPGPEDARLRKPASVLEVERILAEAIRKAGRMEGEHGQDTGGGGRG
ncbi:MAG: PAS domain S-box protein [Candidatus Dadabacteria bacterium]|nr:MAG: PAS domain S-box protein [Candidatus Dadabacteria bacterium]